MASFYFCPVANFVQLLKDSGQLLPNGLIWTYAAGTSTPSATWTDITGGTPNSNPIQLNSAGRLPNAVWQQGGVALKIQFSDNAGTVLAPVFGNQIGPTWDQVSGVDDPAGLLATLINPASGSGADLIANAERTYDIISSVRAANVPNLAAGQTLIINIEGGSAVNDGAGGQFMWIASSTAVDDGVNVIKPTAAGATGRYIRQALPSGTSGSFTTTLTGLTTTPTVTVFYSIAGASGNGTVTCNVVGAAGTSNATTFGLASWPTQLRGNTKSAQSPLFAAQDNSASGISAFLTIPIVTGPTGVVISINNASGNWTNVGTKGIFNFSFSYVMI